MFIVANRLITGLIFKFIKSIVVGVFKFFKLLNLHVTLIIGIIGLITYLAGGFSIVYVQYGFYTLLIASVVIPLLVAFRKGASKKASRGKVQIVSDRKEDKEENAAREDKTEITIKTEKYPKYYRAEKNPSYVWAEYPDRYELYVIEGGGMRLLRRDKKNEN